MAQLSELLSFFRKQQAPPPTQGARSSARQRVGRGFTRGAMGSMGSKTLQTRNPEAGIDKERGMMNSEIFKAFVGKFSPSTPISDFLQRK